MGLFDNLFSDEQPFANFGTGEAYVAVLQCAAACDGIVAESESRSLASGLLRMKLFRDWPAHKIQAVQDECEKILKHKGVEGLLKMATPLLPDELRVTAFANACDLILADGIVEDVERKYLELLCEHLQIDQDTAMNVAEVMIIKNRG
ncbi:tellurite resistance TerB family protein [Telmatocola sphagniphila]|jgi:hypothetical protein|uniref:Tellurite resistance TerB family protein n=1 Tax=Telmatocola sphagniphila TaxID=1123043 RepID=A0A8E6B5Y2_9BACT|nr:tellurite resistance TerB family protein [Telmatocola sphagniphila]QVL31967.1 tellurite resistance TerB family protein [Telmatocola sphagniphila]